MVVCRVSTRRTKETLVIIIFFFFFPFLFLEFVIGLIQDGGELWQRYLYKVFYLTRFSSNIES